MATIKSIEEKARRYDKAIEIAKEINNEQQAQPFNIMTRVFPELKESEDDRVKNEIISAIKEDWPGHTDWIDWLEAQGEHANFLSKIQAGDKVTRNEDGVLVNLSQLNRVAKKDEKQGEQKPADKVEPNDYSRIDPYFFKPVDKVEPKFKIGDKIKLAREPKYPAREIVAIQDDAYYFDEVVHLPFSRQDEWELVEKNHVEMKTPEESLGIDSETYNKIVDECIYGEKKPIEWSEEDETTKNNISHIIRQYDKISKRENQPCYYVGDCLLWMQNIKDRVQPQPKQEWSEEDEKMLGKCIDAASGYYSPEDKQSMKGWLKSLRPQNTWKPSEEQFNNTSCTHLSKEEAESKVWKQ